MSNRCVTTSSRCLVRCPLMSMPRFAMTRTALGCSGFGWLPADEASIVPADIRTSSASTICERALFPVHKNRMLAADAAAPARASAVRFGTRARAPG